MIFPLFFNFPRNVCSIANNTVIIKDCFVFYPGPILKRVPFSRFTYNQRACLIFSGTMPQNEHTYIMADGLFSTDFGISVVKCKPYCLAGTEVWGCIVVTLREYYVYCGYVFKSLLESLHPLFSK